MFLGTSGDKGNLLSAGAHATGYEATARRSGHHFTRPDAAGSDVSNMREARGHAMSFEGDQLRHRGCRFEEALRAIIGGQLEQAPGLFLVFFSNANSPL